MEKSPKLVQRAYLVTNTVLRVVTTHPVMRSAFTHGRSWTYRAPSDIYHPKANLKTSLMLVSTMRVCNTRPTAVCVCCSRNSRVLVCWRCKRPRACACIDVQCVLYNTLVYRTVTARFLSQCTSSVFHLYVVQPLYLHDVYIQVHKWFHLTFL